MGKRFAFGKNWEKFLRSLTEERIRHAESSLQSMLGTQSLQNKTFLDVGSGSGLFSLAARRLGAVVRSFDYDSHSVECTAELKRRFFNNDEQWQVEQGSILDDPYIQSLGQWNIVYSWGVLHHTGNMRKALENAAQLVDPIAGQLFIAIYNDQGPASQRWLRVKQAYNSVPKGLEWIILAPAFVRLWGPTTLKDIARGRPFYTWRNYALISRRGMTAWRDVVDWVGGLPFEVAKPEEIFNFYRERGFSMEQLVTCAGGLGCNEFVFRSSVSSGAIGSSLARI